MEELKAFDFSNMLRESYFTDDCPCAHPNCEHTLIYLCSGELEVEQEGRRTVLHEGECAFMRRDHRMILQRRVSQAKPYRSVVLKFSRNFLREFYQQLDRRSLPAYAQRNRDSLYLLPADRPDIRNLFRSVLPFFEAEVKPSEELLRLKMAEGVYVLLNTDKSLYASLFDFTDPWKIDLMDFMEQNFMDDLSLEEMASYTGRIFLPSSVISGNTVNSLPSGGLSGAGWRRPANCCALRSLRCRRSVGRWASRTCRIFPRFTRRGMGWRLRKCGPSVKCSAAEAGGC